MEQLSEANQVELGKWISLRDKYGRLQARYCPRQQLLLIRERGQTTAHDLSRFYQRIDEDSTPVLESP